MNALRTCRRDHLRETIVERILVGTYPAGMRLKELALAAEFRVSQAPVREALRELEAFGLVQSERYRGARVRAADMQELREAYELRALIEERAAQLATPCSPATLENLGRAFERMKRTISADQQREHAAAATAFHRTVVAASGNATFLRTWDALHWEVRTRVALRQLRDRKVKVKPFIDMHAQVLRYLGAGDGAAAGRILRDMVARVLTAIEQPCADRNPKRRHSAAKAKKPERE
jgi:DNA-binding GntR family transcriptional regulator